MTGWRNRLVVIVRRRLKDEGVKEVIVLHCIIHQQPNVFDDVMPDVKCINHVRSKGLKYQQFRMCLKEVF